MAVIPSAAARLSFRNAQEDAKAAHGGTDGFVACIASGREPPIPPRATGNARGLRGDLPFPQVTRKDRSQIRAVQKKQPLRLP